MTVRVVSRPCPVSDRKVPGNDENQRAVKTPAHEPFPGIPAGQRLARNGLIIRRSEVQVLPAPPIAPHQQKRWLNG